jgi:flagellar motor protein MotB
MTHRRTRNHNEDFNIWPSFTDLMSNIFMISMLLVLLLVLKIPTNKIDQARKDPPIIEIQDSGSYRFTSGSADISSELRQYLINTLAGQIASQVRESQIDVIEVIGHTDAQPNSSGAGNLDLTIEQVASNKSPVSILKASSNADLGLMRALAVVKVLQQVQTSKPELKQVKFRAYSAGQLIVPRGAEASIDAQDSRRRRIEIRFTRDRKATKVG